MRLCKVLEVTKVKVHLNIGIEDQVLAEAERLNSGNAGFHLVSEKENYCYGMVTGCSGSNGKTLHNIFDSITKFFIAFIAFICP
jgi:hypothetical protein